MSRLHPTARALIAAAKRQEGGLPLETRERVHASVLQRAALGAAATGAAATSATTAAATTALAKTGIAVLIAGHPFVAGGLAFVLAAGSGLAIGKTWRASLDNTEEAAHSLDPPARPAPLRAAAVAAPPMTAIASTIVPTIATEAMTVTPIAPTPSAAIATTPPMREASLLSRPSLPHAVDSRAAGQANDLPSTQDAPSPPPTAIASNDRTVGAAPVVASDPLSVQLPILHRVRVELGERHSSQALALLDQYASVLRSGPLVEEAELARVSALCQIGPTSDARTAIERFIARWPGSPMAVALQNGCPSEDLPTGTPGNRHGSR